MKTPRLQRESLRRRHVAARYPGDLANDLGLPPASTARRTRTQWLVTAAAAGVAVAFTLAWLAATTDPRSPDPGEDVTLASIPGPSAADAATARSTRPLRMSGPTLPLSRMPHRPNAEVRAGAPASDAATEARRPPLRMTLSRFSRPPGDHERPDPSGDAPGSSRHPKPQETPT
jgi:hypothetical protein